VSHELLRNLSIPLFTAVIGYVTNWSGVVMLFYPVHFRGKRFGWVKTLVSLLPRKLQEVPGLMHGGLGWQGIIPSRAAKMGSIAVDTGIAKVGPPVEFYRQLEPEKLAEQIVSGSQKDIRALVERIMERERPQLWQSLPALVREAVHLRVQQQLPEIVRSITEQIGENLDQLLDIKLMVIRHLEANPVLCNRVFLDVGKKELRLIQNLGFLVGGILGIPMIWITKTFPQWWVLPIGGVIIGYVTNWVALFMIYEPPEPHRIGPFTWQGLFIKRQPEVAEEYARIISDDIVNLKNIGYELLHGPRADRTRQMIEAALRPAVDRAVGPARSLVRAAVGTREYEAIRSTVATEAVDYALAPLSDPEFSRTQNRGIHRLIASRVAELPPTDFSMMLRSASEDDEWLLLLHGAVLGFGAGLVHLAIFG
jgi:uncharacterized membrane protein YheB (UPF0754 family)